MQMPMPNAAILTNRAMIIARLRQILPMDAVISDPNETRAYECDALTAYRCAPLAAVLPRSTAEVSAVLRLCHELGVPVVQMCIRDSRHSGHQRRGAGLCHLWRCAGG